MLQGLNSDAATDIVGKLDEEGIESEGGRNKASDGVHEALIVMKLPMCLGRMGKGMKDLEKNE